jgi:hypothetical protein
MMMVKLKQNKIERIKYKIILIISINNMELINKYNIYIRDSYDGLISSGKEIDNHDLDKIFEYYSCIQLSKKYKQQFYEYNDIDPTFKEQNKMSRNDTGIDACNLIDTIVQCKLRKDSLRWEDCGTFFGSQNIFDSVLKKTIIKWDNLIITRNKDCKLSKNLKEKQELFTDVTYSRDEIIDYCNKRGYDNEIFYHTNEDYVLTTSNMIIAYPGKELYKNTLCMMPENMNREITNDEFNNIIGLCSDNL